jgi:hypothetical protein
LRELAAEEIRRALTQLESGLASYRWLQERVRRCDVTSDAEFQKHYNAFYRVRRNHHWRQFYFGLLESAKTTGIDFPTALRRINEGTQRIEASFASKVVATLDSTKPVIDRFVLQYFELRLPTSGAVDREAKTVAVYKQLCAKSEEFMHSPTGTMILELFESRYPGSNITPLKKLDLVLWQIRP